MHFIASCLSGGLLLVGDISVASASTGFAERKNRYNVIWDKARRTTVFDQSEATADYASKTVTVTNKTPYDASVRVMDEANKSLILKVPTSQSQKFKF